MLLANDDTVHLPHRRGRAMGTCPWGGCRRWFSLSFSVSLSLRVRVFARVPRSALRARHLRPRFPCARRRYTLDVTTTLKLIMMAGTRGVFSDAFYCAYITGPSRWPGPNGKWAAPCDYWMWEEESRRFGRKVRGKGKDGELMYFKVGRFFCKSVEWRLCMKMKLKNRTKKKILENCKLKQKEYDKKLLDILKCQSCWGNYNFFCECLLPFILFNVYDKPLAFT